MSLFKKVVVGTLIVASVSVGIGAYIIYETGYSPKDLANDLRQVLDGRDVDFEMGPLYPLDYKENYEIQGKEKIALQTKLGEITVVPYDGDELVLTIEGEVAEKYTNNFLEVKETGPSLEIKLFDRSKNISFFSKESHELEITLQIPKAYEKQLNLATISEDIEVNDLKLAGLTLDTISGEVEVYGGQMDEIDLSTVSGDAVVDSQVKFIKGESVSADVSLKQVKGFKVNTVSGDLEVYLEDRLEESKADTVSGNVVIEILGQKEVSYDFDTVSGNITIETQNREISVGKAAKNKGLNGNVVKISTVSGDITLKN